MCNRFISVTGSISKNVFWPFKPWNFYLNQYCICAHISLCLLQMKCPNKHTDTALHLMMNKDTVNYYTKDNALTKNLKNGQKKNYAFKMTLRL